MKADRALPAVESSPALRALLERWQGDPGNTYRGSSLETVWFALAFTCIGLETRVADVVSMQGGRPAVAFLSAQAFNVAWTLALAYLIFGGVLLPRPSSSSSPP
jgi:hypothetical protein